MVTERLRPISYLKGDPGDKGLKGDTGTFAEAQAVSVAADQPARALMYGPESAKGVKFEVPRGLPGTNALANDEAFATYISAQESETRAALESRFTPKDVILVNIADHGVAVDGSADATASVQALIDAAQGMTRLWAPPGTVLRTDGWVTAGKPIIIDFSNAHIIKTSSSPIFEAAGSWGESVSVGGVSTSVTGATLTVADSSGFKVGDLVKLYSDNLIWDARQRESMGTELSRQGQFVTVESVTDTTLSVTPRPVDTYSVNVRVAKLEDIPVEFRFGTASFDAAAGGGAGAAFYRQMFIFDSLWSPRIEGHVLSQPGACLSAQSCYAPSANLQIDDAPQADGYGVHDRGSTFGEYHIVMRRGRHAFTDDAAPRTNAGNPHPGSYGRSMFATVRGKSMGIKQAHWDTHHGGYGHKFIGITATGTPNSGVPGFSLRGQRHELINCTAANMSVGFRFHTEEDAPWATSQRHVMSDCVTREVAHAILADVTQTRTGTTTPHVTVSGGVFETSGSTPIYARQVNLVLNNPLFQIMSWTSGFAAPFILAASSVIGSIQIINATGDLSAGEMVNAANSSIPSRFDCDVYYLSGSASGDGLTGFMRSNNANVSLRLRTTRPFPPPLLVGVTGSAASATHISIEGSSLNSSSALHSQSVSGGSEISLALSGDPTVTVSLASGTSVTVGGVLRGTHSGQILILSNTEGGSGTITIPASGTNLALGSDAAIAPGASLQLVWNSARSNNAWVRAS